MQALITTLEEHGTSAVSDALDRLGVNGGLAGLGRVSGSCRVAGPAFTVGMEPVPDGTRAPAADYIDDVPAGAVIVIATGGTTSATVWGDILTATAAARGIAGTVIDGACRDVDAIREQGYPLWSRSVYMKSGKNRIALRSVGAAVEVCGVHVEQGDLVCADGSGVVVVPQALAAGVAEGVQSVAAMESRVLADVRAGVALREARARHGYHDAALPPRADG